MWKIYRCDQSKRLQNEDQRRGERPHQRKSVSGTNHEIDQRNRPGEKDEDLKEIGQRATPQGVAARPKECTLENESDDDRKKIEARRLVVSSPDRECCSYHRKEKAEGGDDEQLVIHAGGMLKGTTLIGNHRSKGANPAL